MGASAAFMTRVQNGRKEKKFQYSNLGNQRILFHFTITTYFVDAPDENKPNHI